MCYFAAVRAAAGTEVETVALDGPAPGRKGPVGRGMEEMLARCRSKPSPGQPPLGEVLARSSFLLDGATYPDPEAGAPADAVLDVLPPSPVGEGMSDSCGVPCFYVVVLAGGRSSRLGGTFKARLRQQGWTLVELTRRRSGRPPASSSGPRT